MAEMPGAAIQGVAQRLPGACGPSKPHSRQADGLPDEGAPVIPARSNGRPHSPRAARGQNHLTPGQEGIACLADDRQQRTSCFTS
jgi:hypothetical protein